MTSFGNSTIDSWRHRTVDRDACTLQQSLQVQMTRLYVCRNRTPLCRWWVISF